ncbi:hypothetical protein [Citrobacter arsenatis]|uniref:hypothetical protein n=1 Tax=Citrobacter arsenatis TaxID=2546350 RepID=UPI00300E3BB6
MKEKFLLPGFIWLPEKGLSRKTYLLKLDKKINSQFNYIENKENKQRGYYFGELSTESALALYISRYLGDGIYSSDDPKLLDMFVGASNIPERSSGSVYLLVVAKGKIVSGTDIIVKRELFDLFIQQISDTEYSDLKFKILTTEDFFELNKKYASDTISEYKYSDIMLRLLFMIVFIFGVGILTWFVMMA